MRIATAILLALVLFPCGAADDVAAAISPVSVPRFTHPGGSQVLYFVLTDRFANGSTANDTGGIAGGPDSSGFDPTRISHYHGGDFAGLAAKLDYIKGLGATAIWVTPPFTNKPMQNGSAGYHGYWILDFLHIDPHLGTEAEFGEFVAQAHARGLRVFLDIVINHTADVIQYRDGHTDYIPKATAPYRDAQGRPFDPGIVAYNGVNSASEFPTLSAERSFAHVPIVPPGEARAKNPAWLNDVTLYHNRGNSTFEGESSLDGDFGGLDDTFTENPAVVRGFIDIYRHWIEAYGIDGFRIDTVKHVNREFWQAFAPAIREGARRAGRPGFMQFGEVADETGDIALLSEFSTAAPLDATLDFGFFGGARSFVSQGRDAGQLAALFAQDDYYTDHDSNVYSTTTFLGNHDAGRFAYFLQRDNPGAAPEQLAELVKFGYALLFFVRGQPAIYYGDEQGMIGRGGGDMQAREDMFAAQAPEFKTAALLGTSRTGADDKFDAHHPLYQTIHTLAELRTAHPALSRGAMIVRSTNKPHLFAFSRIERSDLVEYLIAFNNSRDGAVTANLATSQPGGATLGRLFDSQDTPGSGAAAPHAAEVLTVDMHGNVTLELAPLQFAVWRAAARLPVPTQAPTITWTSPPSGSALSFPTREVAGHTLVVRQELRAEVTGNDGAAEVTFTMMRASRPGQYELLGTDDAPPYRVFWRPPPDLASGESFSFVATVDDLRGHRAAARIDGLRLDSAATTLVAAPTPEFGPHGATVPALKRTPPPVVAISRGATLTLSVRAEGTAPLYYQWLHDQAEVIGATEPILTIARAADAASGHYCVAVRNVAGTALIPETVVTVAPEPDGTKRQ